LKKFGKPIEKYKIEIWSPYSNLPLVGFLAMAEKIGVPGKIILI
jgi:hypothetical protein